MTDVLNMIDFFLHLSSDIYAFGPLFQKLLFVVLLTFKLMFLVILKYRTAWELLHGLSSGK